MNRSILSDDNNEEEKEEEDDEFGNSEVEINQGQVINTQDSMSKGYFLELALVCLLFGIFLPATLLQNQILKLTCQSFEEYNDTICNALSQNDNSTREIEERLQPYVADVLMVNNLINTIITAVLSLFLGPYSDVYGRKKILNSTFCGYTLSLILFAFITYISENQRGLRPWSYTLAYLPTILSGGFPSLLTAVLCYTTDTNEESKRASRLTIIEAIIFLGVLLGNMSCNFILPRTDTTQVFVISASFAALATVIVILCVDESINVPENVSASDQLRSLVSTRHFCEMIKTSFKKRSSNGRRILLCSISMLVLTVFTYNGSASVAYLFERERFGWTLPQHNVYDSSNIVLSVSGCLIGLTILRKYLKFSDMALILLSIGSAILDSSLKAFASFGWQMYAISAIALFRILANPMIRTMITTIVPQSEIGKVFATTTSIEALTALASSPLYTIVYSKTMIFFPGAFFLISACVFSVNFLLAIFVMMMKRTRESLLSPYAIIEND